MTTSAMPAPLRTGAKHHGGSRGKLIDHATGVACVPPPARTSSYSREMSLFV